MDYLVRQATTEDAERLLEIYAYYVEKTVISFEYVVPTIEEFRSRIIKISRRFPYLVCIADNEIVGYAYANTYSTREAYDWTVTMSIYVDRNYRKHGVGRVLYAEIEKHLKKKGIKNLLAGVAYSEKEDEFLTNDSYYFHLKSGYIKVAHMKAIGKKFNRWYDLLWMQKTI